MSSGAGVSQPDPVSAQQEAHWAQEAKEGGGRRS